MSERCEPPPELRGKDGWHWVQDVSGYFLPACARWQFDGGGIWVFGGTTSARPVYAYRTGYRYLAPVTPPATVAALVEALEAASQQIERMPSGTATGVMAQARAALALYRGEAGR